jgi:hypothetical protein
LFRFKGMVVLISSALLLAAGCSTGEYAGGDTKSDVPSPAASTAAAATASVKEKALTAEEQLAVDFIQVVINAEKGTAAQEQFIKDNVSAETQDIIKEGFKELQAYGYKTTDVKSVESIKKKMKNGNEATMILINELLEKKQHETIVMLENDKVVMFSLEELEDTHMELRNGFKTPVSQGIKEAQEKAKAEPKLEIVQKSSQAWKDSIKTVWVHSAAVLKNTGDVPIDIGSIQFNFEDKDGGILGTEKMVIAYPDIIQPGETAFIGETSILDGVTDPNEFKETTINFSFDKTSDEKVMLEVSGTKGKQVKDFGFSSYKVTGSVKNQTTEIKKSISVAAGLFDAEGNILGVMKGGIDVGINPGSQAGFDLGYPDIPENVINKIATIEVKAYSRY